MKQYFSSIFQDGPPVFCKCKTSSRVLHLLVERDASLSQKFYIIWFSNSLPVCVIANEYQDDYGVMVCAEEKQFVEKDVRIFLWFIETNVKVPTIVL